MNPTRRFRISLFLALTAFIMATSGCASNNPYRTFYTSNFEEKSVSKIPGLIPFTGNPRILTGNLRYDSIRLFEAGYVPLGYASFQAPLQDMDTAKRRARELRAAAVTLSVSNPQTVTKTVRTNPYASMAAAFSQSMSDQLSGDSQETTQTSGTIYGDGESVSYTETSKKSTPKKNPPASKSWQETYTLFDHQATFWAKSQPHVLGIWPRDLTVEERSHLGGYKGLAVFAVAKGSPAFNGDILRGDIISRIGVTQVREEIDLDDALNRYAGSEVELELMRKEAGDSEEIYAKRIVRIKLNESTAK